MDSIPIFIEVINKTNLILNIFIIDFLLHLSLLTLPFLTILSPYFISFFSFHSINDKYVTNKANIFMKNKT